MNSLPKAHLDRVKRRLGIAGRAEAQALNDFVADAIQDILNFCNREDLPPELYHEAARIAGDAYLLGRIASMDPETLSGMVSSVSMAGVSQKFGLTSDQRDIMNKKLEEQIKGSDILKQFRLLRRVAMPHKKESR